MIWKPNDIAIALDVAQDRVEPAHTADIGRDAADVALDDGMRVPGLGGGPKSFSTAAG